MTGLKAELEGTGLSPIEAEVYEALAAFGYRTVGQVQLYVNKPLEEIQQALEQLTQKGYVKKISGKSEQANIYLALSPKIVVSADIAAKLNRDLKAIQEKIVTEWEHASQALQQKTSSLISQAEATSSKHLEEINAKKSERIQALSQWETQSVEKISAIIKTNTESLLNLIESQVNDLIETIDSSSEDVLEVSKTQRKAALNYYQSFSAQLKENLADAQKAITSLMGNLEAMAVKAVEEEKKLCFATLASDVQLFEKAVSELLQSYESRQTALVETVDDLGASLSSETKSVFESHSQAVLSSIRLFHEWLEERQQTLHEAVAQASDQIVQSLRNILDDLHKQYSLALNDLHAGFSDQVNATKEVAIQTLGKTATDVSKSLTNTKKTLEKTLNNYLTSMKNQLDSLETTLNESLSTEFASIKTLTQEFSDNLTTKIGDFSRTLSSNVEELKQFLIDFMQQYVERSQETLSGFIEQLHADLQKILKTSQTAIANKNQELSNALSQTIDQLDAQFEKTISDLKEKTSQATKHLEDTTNQIGEMLESRSQSSLEKFSEAVKNAQSQQQKILTEIEAAIQRLLSEAETAKQNFVRLLTQRINEISSTYEDGVTTSVKQITDRIDREFDRLTERQERIVEEFLDTFLEKTNRFRYELPDIIETLFEEHIRRLNSIKQQYNSTLQRADLALQDLVARVEQNTKKVFGPKKEAEEQLARLTSLKSELTKVKQDLDAFLEPAIIDSENTKDEALNRATRLFTEEFDDLRERLSEEISKLVKITQESKQTVHQGITESSQTFTSEFEIEKAKLIDSISTQLQNFFSTPLETIITKAKAAALSIDPETEKNLLAEATIEFERQVQSLINEIRNDLAELIEQSRQVAQKIESTYVGDVSELASNAKGSIKRTQESAESTIKTVSEDLIATAQQAFENAHQKGLELLEQSNANAKQTLGQQTEQLEATVAQGIDQLTTASEKASDDIKQAVGTFMDNLEKASSDVSTTLHDHVETAKNEQAKTVKTTTTEIGKSIEATVKLLEGTKAKLDKEIGVKLDNSLKSSEELVSTIDERFSKTVEDAKERVTLAQEPLTVIVDEINSTTKSIDEKIQETDIVFSKEAETLESKVSAQIEATKGQLVSHLENMKSEAENAIMSSQESLKEEQEKVSESLEQETKRVVDTMGKEKERVISSANKSLEDAVYGFDTKVKAELDALDTGVRETIDKVSVEAQKAKTGLEAGLKTQSGSIQTAFSNANNEISSLLQSRTEEDKKEQDHLMQQYIAAIQSLLDDYKSSIAGQAKQSTEELTQVINNIPEAINQALQQTASALEVLDKISKGLREVDPKAIERSYIEAGKEALTSTMNAMLASPKRSVTIVSSRIYWMREDVLDQLKDKHHIIVITDPQEHDASDEKILAKLRSIPANVDIRRFSSQRANILIAERDAEQFLIGTPLDNSAPYAVITIDESLITLFGQLVAPLRGGSRL